MKVLIVDDEIRFATILRRSLEAADLSAEVAASAEAALASLAERPVDLVVTDLRLSGRSGIDLIKNIRERHPGTGIVLMTAFADAATACEALREGALDYLIKPFDVATLMEIIERVRNAREPAQVELPTKAFGQSTAYRQHLLELREAAETDDPVLIIGEPGSGKSVAARLLHRLSTRSRSAFIEARLRSLPVSQMEGQIFGSPVDQGDQRGPWWSMYRLAGRGTLYLADIDLLPHQLQERLVRILDACPPAKAPVRVIAALSHQSGHEPLVTSLIPGLIDRFRFRPIIVPPLRSRDDDISILVAERLRSFGRRDYVPQDLISRLRERRWPENIAELHAVIDAVHAVAGDEGIEGRHWLAGLS